MRGVSRPFFQYIPIYFMIVEPFLDGIFDKYVNSNCQVDQCKKEKSEIPEYTTCTKHRFLKFKAYNTEIGTVSKNDGNCSGNLGYVTIEGIKGHNCNIFCDLAGLAHLRSLGFTR